MVKLHLIVYAAVCLLWGIFLCRGTFYVVFFFFLAKFFEFANAGKKCAHESVSLVYFVFNPLLHTAF